jgi:hypothetical protein
MQSEFAGMTKGRMSQVMSQTHSLDQVGVRTQSQRDAFGDLGYFE